MKISVTSNIDQVIAEFAGYGDQVRFATAVAMTRTMKDAEAEAYAEMQREWDRPTPFAKRSLFVRPATKVRLESSVEIKDRFPSKATYSPDQTYQHQYFGGQRQRKGIERYAQRAGLISAGEWLVPATGAKLDAYGNMSRGQVAQILSQLKLGLDGSAWSTSSTRSKRNQARAGLMFWSHGGRRGWRDRHLDRGVWVRDDRVVTPIMLVASSLTYRPRINLDRIAQRTIDRRFAGHFDAALAMARATAR